MLRKSQCSFQELLATLSSGSWMQDEVFFFAAGADVGWVMSTA